MFESIKRISLEKKEDLYFERIWSAIIRRLVDVPQRICYFWPWGFYAENRRRISTFKDRHKGKRCFIIANGPSLKGVNFDLLKNEFTIGMNRIYMMKNKNGFIPTYLACIDVKSQILQIHEDLDKLDIPCFFNFNLRSKFSKKDNQYFIKDKFSPAFQTDCSKMLGSGGSVTYSAIQLAYYMGFKEVYIIGKDHSYNTTQAAGKNIKADGNESNHFIKGYYKPGQTWDAPNYVREEYAYSLSRRIFEKSGIVIRDATIGGHLMVFEKKDFNSLFE